MRKPTTRTWQPWLLLLRLLLMLICPLLSWLLPLLRYRPAPVLIFLRCSHRSCVDIFTVLPPEGTSRPVIWNTTRTVQTSDRSAAEAVVDVDVPAVVVADAVVEVPPRSCADHFTVLPPEDTSCPASWKTTRMVQARDRQISKEKSKRLIVKGKLAKSNAATTKANVATNKAKDQLRAV